MSSPPRAQNTVNTPTMQTMQTYTVAGMTCDHSIAAVRQELGQEAGDEVVAR